MFGSIKKIMRSMLTRAGYDVVSVSSRSFAPRVNVQLTDLTRYRSYIETIPGMVSIEAAELLYALCAAQQVPGNVVEIGSWQGRSTSYLARAVKDSGNGRVFAIDHFRGNLGRESLYEVGGTLDNLKGDFERNMRVLDLEDVVTLLPYSSDDAHAEIAGKDVRFLFIDGDHTEAGVRRDVELYCPLVKSGGIVVFDDFDATFPGVVLAAQEWIKLEDPRIAFVRGNTLVCQKK